MTRLEALEAEMVKLIEKEVPVEPEVDDGGPKCGAVATAVNVVGIP